MPETMTPEIITVKSDMTLRLPCRGGDYFLWFGAMRSPDLSRHRFGPSIGSLG